ncbi:MAG: ACT domain-containing protein [Synergistales bacterium]|nr:ACT domain-containing protein [Synergistales bacterium]
MELKVIRILEEMFNEEKDFQGLYRSLKRLCDYNCLPVLVVSSTNPDGGDPGYGSDTLKGLDRDPCLMVKREDRFCQVISVILAGKSLKCKSFRVEDNIFKARTSRDGTVICERESLSKLQEVTINGIIPIIPGSFSLLPESEPGYLGWNGADLSAVVLVEALQQTQCYLWSGKRGLSSSNLPGISTLKSLGRISYGECLEMAAAGMNVPSARAVERAENSNIRICVCRPDGQEEGTWIMSEVSGKSVIIKAVALDKETAKIAVLGVPDRPGIAARLFSGLAAEGICVEMILQSVMRGQINDIAFLVDKRDIEKTITACRDLSRQLGAQGVTFDTEIARVSVVGAGISSHAEIPSRVFSILAGKGINIEMISASSMAITCVVSSLDGEAAVHALHHEFMEDK